MISLLIGKKGTGKTKKLIELANKAVKESKGCVVVIEKGQKLTYDIDHDARLINVDEYSVGCGASLCGFISGILAANYDVTDIFVDSTLKIIAAEDLEKLVQTLAPVAKDITVTFLVSADAADLPASLMDYVAQ